MKIKRIVSDKGRIVTQVIGPTAKEKKAFKEFKAKITNGGIIQPCVRGARGKELVPSAGQHPCEVCGLAEYGIQCTHAHNCMAMTYYMFERLINIDKLPKEFNAGGAVAVVGPTKKRDVPTKTGAVPNKTSVVLTKTGAVPTKRRRKKCIARPAIKSTSSRKPRTK